jgi:hypothetical protein
MDQIGRNRQKLNQGTDLVDLCTAAALRSCIMLKRAACSLVAGVLKESVWFIIIIYSNTHQFLTPAPIGKEGTIPIMAAI